MCLPFDHEAAPTSLVVLALSAPKQRNDPDQCGAKDVRIVPKARVIGSKDTSFGCEMCLDMVLIAETYAECDEAKIEHKLEDKCDTEYPNNKAADKACRDSVDKIAHSAIEDTNKNATGVCYDILHTVCVYSLEVYNPYQ